MYRELANPEPRVPDPPNWLWTLEIYTLGVQWTLQLSAHL